MPAVDRVATCTACGSSLDSLHFDAIGFADLPLNGGVVVIAKHELPRQYCGVLEGFQQFLGELRRAGDVETPGIEWLLRANGRPLDPYIGFSAILNPWGQPINRVAVSLEEGTVLEMIARVTRPSVPAGTRIGGRLVGRYWFDDPYVRSRPR